MFTQRIRQSWSVQMTTNLTASVQNRFINPCHGEISRVQIDTCMSSLHAKSQWNIFGRMKIDGFCQINPPHGATTAFFISTVFTKCFHAMQHSVTLFFNASAFPSKMFPVKFWREVPDPAPRCMPKHAAAKKHSTTVVATFWLKNIKKAPVSPTAISLIGWRINVFFWCTIYFETNIFPSFQNAILWATTGVWALWHCALILRTDSVQLIHTFSAHRGKVPLTFEVRKACKTLLEICEHIIHFILWQESIIIRTPNANDILPLDEDRGFHLIVIKCQFFKLLSSKFVNGWMSTAVDFGRFDLKRQFSHFAAMFGHVFWDDNTCCFERVGVPQDTSPFPFESSFFATSSSSSPRK